MPQHGPRPHQTRPFRFGVQCGLGASIRDPKAWLDDARMLEDLGFSNILIPDHFAPILSAMPALAAAAQVTSRLRLGTLVINQAWRHPAVLAKEAATVDFLSGGRLDLGLGTGWVPREQEQVGIPFESPGVRVDRFEEYVRVVKGLLNQDSLTFSGKYYQVTELEGLPRSTQRPVPVLIGGSQRRLLSLAAQEADVVAFTLGAGPAPGQDPAAMLDEKIGWVREAAGTRFADIELSLMVTGGLPVGTERQEAARQVAEGGLVSAGRGGADKRTEAEILAAPTTILGTVDQVVEALLERRERYGISYYTYFPPGDRTREFVKAFAPVVAKLTGA